METVLIMFPCINAIYRFDVIFQDSAIEEVLRDFLYAKHSKSFIHPISLNIINNFLN